MCFDSPISPVSFSIKEKGVRWINKTERWGFLLSYLEPKVLESDYPTISIRQGLLFFFFSNLNRSASTGLTPPFFLKGPPHDGSGTSMCLCLGPWRPRKFIVFRETCPSSQAPVFRSVTLSGQTQVGLVSQTGYGSLSVVFVVVSVGRGLGTGQW